MQRTYLDKSLNQIYEYFYWKSIYLFTIKKYLVTVS